MVRVSSPAKLRLWSESTAKMVMGVVPGLVKFAPSNCSVNLFQPEIAATSSLWWKFAIMIAKIARFRTQGEILTTGVHVCTIRA